MKPKTSTIILDKDGSYLGMEKGCFVVRDRHNNVERYPLFENEVKEVVLKTGSFVSTGALTSLGFWGVDVLVLTRRNKPVAILRSLNNDSHVETRVCQYEALKNGVGIKVAKSIISAKVESQNLMLKKHGLKQLDLLSIKNNISSVEPDNLRNVRKKLIAIEGRTGQHYFREVFKLLSKDIRIKHRRTFRAYDGINNIFNLAYTILSWKVHRALLKAKLEPYLGFLHSQQFSKPSLVYDLMELYRYLVDYFIIKFCRNVKKKDFIVRVEDYSSKKKGKREYLNEEKTGDLVEKLFCFFDSYVNVSRIRHGSRQTVETLINEEALLLAKYLRKERKTWNPRIVMISPHKTKPVFK